MAYGRVARFGFHALVRPPIPTQVSSEEIPQQRRKGTDSLHDLNGGLIWVHTSRSLFPYGALSLESAVERTRTVSREFNEVVFTKERRPLVFVRLVYPESRSDRNDVIIRRGDWITLAIDFLHEQPSTHISMNGAEVPLPTHLKHAKSYNSLRLEMELWNVKFPHHPPFKAFCGLHHSPYLTNGACGCVVRFHGQHFPIKDQKVGICFEFPIVANGCEELQEYKYVDARMLLRW